jgi:hypothetical protein
LNVAYMRRRASTVDRSIYKEASENKERSVGRRLLVIYFIVKKVDADNFGVFFRKRTKKSRELKAFGQL